VFSSVDGVEVASFSVVDGVEVAVSSVACGVDDAVLSAVSSVVSTTTTLGSLTITVLVDVAEFPAWSVAV
jgi:hypothetical protein